MAVKIVGHLIFYKFEEVLVKFLVEIEKKFDLLEFFMRTQSEDQTCPLIEDILS